MSAGVNPPQSKKTHRAIGAYMAFESNKSKQSKNMFTARLVSLKTGAMVSWVHITDDFSRKVFGVMKASEVTAEQAEEVLPSLLGNDYVEVKVTDMTADLEPIAATEF